MTKGIDMKTDKFSAVRQDAHDAFNEIRNNADSYGFVLHFDSKRAAEQFENWHTALLERIEDIYNYVVAFENAILASGLQLR